MAEWVGLVASVIQVASGGLRLSRNLRDYGSAVQGYEKRLKGIDKDIHFTSSIISELATLLKDPRVQSLVSERSIQLTQEIVAEFKGMFDAIEDIIGSIRADNLGKWKMYFRESRIRLLLSNSDRLKGNLQLLIGVITHASQVSTKPLTDATMIAHRIRILELMVEKEEYTQRYLDEKRKYDNLMIQINATSTLGSVSTVQTENGTGTWRVVTLIGEPHFIQDSVSGYAIQGINKGKEVATVESTDDISVVHEGETQAPGNSVEDQGVSLQQLKKDLAVLKALVPSQAESSFGKIPKPSNGQASLSSTSERNMKPPWCQVRYRRRPSLTLFGDGRTYRSQNRGIWSHRENSRSESLSLR